MKANLTIIAYERVNIAHYVAEYRIVNHRKKLHIWAMNTFYQ